MGDGDQHHHQMMLMMIVVVVVMVRLVHKKLRSPDIAYV